MEGSGAIQGTLIQNEVPSFRKLHLADWARRHRVVGSEVGSDDLQGFDGVTEAGCRHPVVVSGGGACRGGEAGVLLGQYRARQSEVGLA